ncbi:MAG: ABC transporter substrate-binding protein, partial [Clostridia bacterium]|nr:ABC transporter substrate-binding protein [Clostridia bacterium]
MKNKRLTVLILLTLTLSLLLLPVLSGCNSNKVYVLKVYNCQDYIQHGKEESVLRDFEKYYEEKTGQKVRVQYDTFDTLERAYTIINKREADYDVMCPSDYIIEKMKKNNLLIELDKNKIPNLANIPPYLLDRNFDRGNKYSVPYMWGTVGIMYNSDNVSEEDLDNWNLLWNNKYKNKILMKDSIRDSVFIATIYAYREELAELAKTATPEEYRDRISDLTNNITAEKLEIVEKELRTQYDILYAYEVDSGKDSMINGEAYVNLAWSGDAVWAIEEALGNNINLDYYIPEEGSNIWFDNWVIPKYAKNVDIAHEFINFMCDPDIALRNMDETGYTTAVLSPEIIDYMTDEEVEINDFTYLFEDKDGNISQENYALLQQYKDEYGIDFSALQIPEITMPSAEKAERLVEMTDFGEKQDLVVKMWTRVKALPLGVEVKIFSILLAISIVAIIIYSIYKKVEKKKLVAVKIEQMGNGTASAS